MKATIQVLYAQKGFYEDSNTKEMKPWANVYTTADPMITPDMVGVKPGKMPIVDVTGTASHEICDQILAKLRDAKQFPCNIDVNIGQKIKEGSMSMTVTGLA